MSSILSLIILDSMNEITHFNQLDISKVYTYADYYSWKFKERVELIKGKVFKMSSAPRRVHQKVSMSLGARLFNFFEEHSCEVYTAPFDVRFPTQNKTSDKTKTVLQPDICVICDLEKLDDYGCFGAPDLIVEILSPSNSKKEMKYKYEIYEEAGVREYWIVNLVQKHTIIYTLNEEGTFIGQKPVVEDAVLSSYIFPELKINQADIFKGI